jgi:hypothetical protein
MVATITSKNKVNSNKKKTKARRKARSKKEILKERFIEELTKNPIKQIVCQKLNVGKSTFYRWNEEDDDFKKKIIEATIKGNDVINDLTKSQLISKIKDGDTRAILYWLKRRHPEFIEPVYIANTEDKKDRTLSLERKIKIVEKIKQWKNTNK